MKYKLQLLVIAMGFAYAHPKKAPAQNPTYSLATRDSSFKYMLFDKETATHFIETFAPEKVEIKRLRRLSLSINPWTWKKDKKDKANKSPYNGEMDVVYEIEIEIETEPQPEPQLEPQLEPQSQSESESESQSESQSESESESESEPQLESESEPQLEPPKLTRKILVNIEMQANREKQKVNGKKVTVDLTKRAWLYLTSLYANQFKTGSDWHTIKEVWGINILGAEKIDGHVIVEKTRMLKLAQYSLAEIQYKAGKLTSSSNTNFSSLFPDGDQKNHAKQEWLTLLKHSHKMTPDQLKKISIPQVQQAFERLKIRDPLPRELCSEEELVQITKLKIALNCIKAKISPAMTQKDRENIFKNICKMTELQPDIKILEILNDTNSSDITYKIEKYIDEKIPNESEDDARNTIALFKTIKASQKEDVIDAADPIDEMNARISETSQKQKAKKEEKKPNKKSDKK